MKKILLLTLLACFSTLRLHAMSGMSREEAVSSIGSCEAILQEFMANPATAIPAAVLQKARALIIVNQFKAGFLFGIKDGYGVMLVKKANGQWSIPVLLAAGELSFGFQLGVDAIESVLVITDEETPRLLFHQRFNVGVDAKAVAGPRFTEVEKLEKDMLNIPVLIYTKKRGLYAGATIKTGWLQRSDEVNFKLYDTHYTMPELLYSDWVKPTDEVKPLMDYVQKIAP